MGFFTKRRKDGKYVSQKGSYSILLPYVCRSRTESCIYYSRQVRVGALMDFLAKQKEQGAELTFFNVVMAALVRTATERPHLNRFIAGRRLYQRKTFDASYIVKIEKSDTGGDTIANLKFSGGETLEQIAPMMNNLNKKLRKESNEDADFWIKAIGVLPRFLIRFFVWFLRWTDFNGIQPKGLMEVQPYFGSIFIANLGSIGIDAPFHHLYDNGTTSIFLTIGNIHDAPVVDENGDIVKDKVVNMAFTLDERIADGFYMGRSIEIFENYLKNPQLL